MKTIAFYNIKGGVGKTTSIINFACLLAKQNLSVLIWDADAQGGTSFFFNSLHKNNNTYKKLFLGGISIYDAIQHADIHHIDIISNDSQFNDVAIQQASGIGKIDYFNANAVKNVLETVADDYDVCLIDCPPGKSIMHDNIFTAAHLVMVPNVPSALSMNCVEMLFDDFAKNNLSKKLLSFFNMVQIRKKMHKQFIEQESEKPETLQHYIPFYAEIETIGYNKKSIFHALKESKSLLFYENVWAEVCKVMSWPILNISSRGKVISIDQSVANNYANAAFEEGFHVADEACSNMHVAQQYSYL